MESSWRSLQKSRSADFLKYKYLDVAKTPSPNAMRGVVSIPATNTSMRPIPRLRNATRLHERRLSRVERRKCLEEWS